MNKILFFFILVVMFCGCATYERRINLSPQKAPNWKELNSRHFKSGCNQGEIEVSPLVLGVEGSGSTFFFIPIPSSKERLKIVNEEGPWIYVKFRSKTRIESCDLSFISLEDQKSGNQINPFRAETAVFNDDYSEIHQTDCRYFFDLKKNPESKYNLHVSKEVFNCDLEPIPYTYEKACEIWPMQMM